MEQNTTEEAAFSDW